ncbi:LA2681 family HEPN domain-containing protein [Thiobacillus sp.]|uniref:LA2681 family HEPN domain-containing protein n=1 Tax=Thiobacillus sp. TaxID=924 RepID=UPI0025FAED57|nr:LA2681 family HEPN domain-containing protein [Thiobacillus sp.]
MHKPTINGLSDADALDLIAQLVDQASDADDLALACHALSLADDLGARKLEPPEMALLDYFRANAWACRYKRRLGDREAVWDFEQPEVRQQVFLLRRAANSSGFTEMDAIRRCQILTNLGNQLDTLGRFVEARAYWSAALAIDTSFWMARANRGRALMHYAAALYDPGHHAIFAFHAHQDLVEAVALAARYPYLGDYRLAPIFMQSAEQIAHHYDVEAIGKARNPDGWGMGEDAMERAYRRWCLENILFLNPLNDVEKASVAAHDIMSLPDFITEINEPPIVTGMFNALKQEFVSARWMLWEGIRSEEPHFSDREVLLYNTMDYPSYGLSVEKVKMAFRMAYSILDKIAYFLNHYLALGIPEKRISFRTIWRDKDNGPVRDRFVKSENWPIRGLFWLSKDLFEEDMRDSTEPGARALAELRHHLEHKYVKVHEMRSVSSDPFCDTLAHSISRSDLEQRTLRLVQLARSALIYLSLGMHREERERAKRKRGLTATISLDPLPDEWKR